MNKIRLLIVFIIIPVSQVWGHAIKNEPGQLIRIGVFANPPVAFKDKDGQWQGITIDVLQAIAKQQAWEIEFVAGSFTQQLDNFEKHQIDLISMMAYSEQRAKKYTFSQNALISNWGLIYSLPGSNMNSIFDLQGKRIAVMRNNIHDKAFRKLVNTFGLKLKIVEHENFSDVMESVRAGKVDAGVVNRLFGALNANKYGVVETGIIFNPINMHYAALDPDSKAVLDVIDEQLSAFKADKNSVYFQALHRWMSQSENSQIPRWLTYIAISLLSVLTLMFGLTYILRRQVAARTQELSLEVDERRLIQHRLEERTAELCEALELAEEASHAKSEFLSHMSHELRTPLNAIMGFGQILEMEPDELNETQRENVKEILKAGEHLLSLINEVLDLAKIESGKMTVNMQNVALDELLLQSKTLVQPQANAHQLEIVDNISGKGYILWADCTRVKQVLKNILSNAVKYNRDQGRITLHSELLNNQRLRINITDTGEGLTEEDMTNLFIPFERLNVVNNVEGTGIGLVVTKYLVELMGGSIGVESLPGEGCTFWIELAMSKEI